MHSAPRSHSCCVLTSLRPAPPTDPQALLPPGLSEHQEWDRPLVSISWDSADHMGPFSQPLPSKGSAYPCRPSSDLVEKKALFDFEMLAEHTVTGPPMPTVPPPPSQGSF